MSSSAQIRPADPSDREAIDAVVSAAFGEEGAVVVPLWNDVVRRDLSRAELVAVDDGGEVVGHVGLSHSWLDARPRLVDLLVLSPLSVAPDRQRSGIGAALLEAAVVEAERLGAPYVVLEGDPGYYSRRGWLPGSTFGLEAPSTRTPAPAFQAVALPAREAWMTGRVIYREVWWDHDSAGLRDPILAQIEAALAGS